MSHKYALCWEFTSNDMSLMSLFLHEVLPRESGTTSTLPVGESTCEPLPTSAFQASRLITQSPQSFCVSCCLRSGFVQRQSAVKVKSVDLKCSLSSLSFLSREVEKRKKAAQTSPFSTLCSYMLRLVTMLIS